MERDHEMRKKTAKRNSKPKTAKPATKLSTAGTAPVQGYVSHKDGSRKGKVHQLFDEQGAEAAWVLGIKLKLKEGTLRSWFAAWKRVQSKSKTEINSNSGTPPAINRMAFPQPVKPRTRKQVYLVDLNGPRAFDRKRQKKKRSPYALSENAVLSTAYYTHLLIARTGADAPVA